MSFRVTAARARILSQAGMIAALAGLAAACSADATRVREPFFTGSTANQREIIGGAGQSGPVVATNLPPPPGTAGGPINLVNGAPADGAWSPVGGTTVTVGPGESLETLSLKYGVPIVELARANGISNPSQVTAGRTLVIPRQAEAAYAPEPIPVSAPASPAAVVKGGDVIHVVEPGETLYGIARAQGVRPGDIMAVNGLATENIRVGQRLTMPSTGRSASVQTASLTTDNGSPTRGAAPKILGTLPVGPANTLPGAASPPPAPASLSTAPQPPGVPAVPATTGGSSTPAAAAAAIDDSVDPPSGNGTTFRWPVRGRIIEGFGEQPSGEKNDGINLAVPAGTSVKAAEAGTVIYSGNELAGYGNLVLIRHADGWVSAYAHNSTLDVQRGDTVKRGQTIAQAGMTGSVNAPQVHFELRKGAKPVNPMDYLSGT